MTIEGMLVAGGIAGTLIGLTARRERIGCSLLLVIPVIAFAYIWVWQAQHPESLRSASALDFVFGPLWPSIGGVLGYLVGRLGRAATRIPPGDPDQP